jgi:ferritin-like metal-binding protein YciE
MLRKTSDTTLRQEFEDHLRETHTHVQRLNQVFDLYGVAPQGTSCPAIDGIITETNDITGEVEDARVLDAALIAAAQAVEHYEIARYGTLVAWAKQFGRNDCAALLQQNLNEEIAADKNLTAIAVSGVNQKAA